MLPGVDMCRIDPAQRLVAAGWVLDDLSVDDL